MRQKALTLSHVPVLSRVPTVSPRGFCLSVPELRVTFPSSVIIAQLYIYCSFCLDPHSAQLTLTVRPVESEMQLVLTHMWVLRNDRSYKGRCTFWWSFNQVHLAPNEPKQPHQPTTSASSKMITGSRAGVRLAATTEGTCTAIYCNLLQFTAIDCNWLQFWSVFHIRRWIFISCTPTTALSFFISAVWNWYKRKVIFMMLYRDIFVMLFIFYQVCNR